jgi:hypothetical protein
MKSLELAKKNGLIMPTQEVCVKCHNKENPFHKEFNYTAQLAKVSHPNPTLKK